MILSSLVLLCFFVLAVYGLGIGKIERLALKCRLVGFIFCFSLSLDWQAAFLFGVYVWFGF